MCTAALWPKRQIILVDNIQHVELKAYPFERLFKLATRENIYGGLGAYPALFVRGRRLYAQSLAHNSKKLK